MTPVPDRRLAISRTLDATRLNEVANDPQVRPHLLLEEAGPLDLSAVVGDPRNYCFETESGGFLCVALGYGRYEVHSLFLPTRAPKLTVTAMRASTEYLFTRTDCVELVTKVPEGNRPAGQLAALAHFEERFVAPVAPKSPLRARYLALSLDTWALHACGVPHVIKTSDGLHDQMTGVAMLMIRNGQVEKGIGFYNRFARWVGRTAWALVSVAPPVFDLGDAVVELREEMEVLSCR